MQPGEGNRGVLGDPRNGLKTGSATKSRQAHGRCNRGVHSQPAGRRRSWVRLQCPCDRDGLGREQWAAVDEEVEEFAAERPGVGSPHGRGRVEADVGATYGAHLGVNLVEALWSEWPAIAEPVVDEAGHEPSN